MQPAVDTRDTAFGFSADYIEDDKGAEGVLICNKWGTQAGIVDGSSLVPRSGNTDIIFCGWIACNGGTSKLVYRVNGGEWMECGNQPDTGNIAGADILNAVESYNLGIKNFQTPGRFRVTAPLDNYKGQTVTVELAFVPENNPTVSVTFITVTGVKVPN